MLSVYKILRPPKKGNCSNDKTEEDINWKDITFEDFMTAFNKNYVISHRQNHIENIKKVIEDLVVYDHWKNEEVRHLADEMSDDIMDHLLYTNTGYICHKMLQKPHVKSCAFCSQAFASCEENSIFPLANLIEIKTQGKLIYPNLQLFHLIKKIDQSFNKYVKKKNDVYNIIIQELVKNKVILTFPCNAHKVDIIAEIIYFYIFICMHFFKKNEQRIQKIESKHLSKEAKLKKK